MATMVTLEELAQAALDRDSLQLFSSRWRAPHRVNVLSHAPSQLVRLARADVRRAWEDEPDRAPMPLPRGGCAVGVLDGRMILAGGTYWSEGRKIWSDRVDFFDPVANRWEPAASDRGGRCNMAGWNSRRTCSRRTATSSSSPKSRRWSS